MFQLIQNADRHNRFFIALPDTADVLVRDSGIFKYKVGIPELGFSLQAGYLQGELLKAIIPLVGMECREVKHEIDGFMPSPQSPPF